MMTRVTLITLAALLCGLASATAAEKVKAKRTRATASEYVPTSEEEELIRQARIEFEKARKEQPPSKSLRDRMQDEMNTVPGGDDRQAIEDMLPHLSPRALRLLRQIAEKLPREERGE